MPYPSDRHVSGIDSIRALSALSVLLAHTLSPHLEAAAPFAKYLFTGAPAVVAFFVISGFCIHYPYLQKPLFPAPFLIARYVRISVPLLAAIVFALLGRVKGYNLWDGYILWSVVCELFYYTLYPLLFLISRWVSFRQQYLLALGVSYGLVFTLGSDRYGNMHIYGPFLNWLVALPNWLLGCVLAEVAFKDRSLRGRIDDGPVSILLWRFIVAATASTLCWLTLNTAVGFYITLNFFALLVFFWVNAEIGASPRRGSSLEAVGKWSYSIYLMHMPVYFILGRLFKLVLGKAFYLQSASYLLPACIPLDLCLCYVFYRNVEVPSHAYARSLFRTLQTQKLPEEPERRPAPYGARREERPAGL